jgi:hypothetical protein
MQTTFRSATRLLLGLAVVAAAACGGDSGGSTGPNPDPVPAGDVAGSYALTQVRTLGHLGGGGTGLPVTFTDGSGDQLVFQSGTLILTEGAFDLKVQVTFKGNPSELTDYGTYSVSGGGSVDFHSQKSSPRLSSGTISGNKITANSQFVGIAFEIDVQR